MSEPTGLEPTSKAAERSNAARITRAASEILLEAGVAGLSVRAIAARAGLSTIGIYTHFQGKQGILDALFIEGFAQIQASTEAAYDVEDRRDALKKGVLGYIAVAKANPAQYNLIFGQADAKYEPGENASQARSDAFQALVKLVSKWLPPDSAAILQQRTALRFWATIHGYVSLLHNGPSESPIFRDFENQIIDTMLVLLAGTEREA